MPSTASKSSTSTLVFITAFTLSHGSAAHADQWSWNAGSGNWTSPGNWTPNGIPGVDPFATTNIDIGNLPGVENDTVLLSIAPYGPLHYDDLDIHSGMTLDMGGGQLICLWGETTLADVNTTLIVRPSVGPEIDDLTSHQIVVGVGTHLQVDDGAQVITTDLWNHGLISGEGLIRVQGNGPEPRFTNTGTLTGGTSGGLVILVQGDGPIDLNGVEAETQILLAAPYSQLTLEADRLTDSLDGVVTMGSGSLLTMNIAEGWDVHSSSSINASSSIPGAAAQIAGTHAHLRGEINVGGSHGHLRVLSDALISNLIDVFLGTNDILEMEGETEIWGGNYTLSQGARIDFDGPTIIRDGNFHMVSDNYLDGVVNFNDNVEWYGNVQLVGPTTFNGTVRVNDTATVTDISVIDAEVLDMDGASNDSTWFIQYPLTINAGKLDTTLANPNSMDGYIDIGGSIQAKLTLNLTDPEASWQMGGTLQLRGLGPLSVTRVAGAGLQVNGYLTVSEGLSLITADLTMDDLAQLHIADGSTLRVLGETRLEAGFAVFGRGTIQNGVGGDLIVYTGLELGELGLRNDAQMEIGEDGAGIATVDRFTAGQTGNWIVEVGGHVPASEFDRLEVDGDVVLAGRVTVEPIDGFEPAPGATFEFLRWNGTRTGEFDAVMSCDGARVFYGRQSAWIEFGVGILGDVNGDGVVDGDDLAIVLGQWGACASACCPSDLNQDGMIDGADIAIVLGHWTM